MENTNFIEAKQTTLKVLSIIGLITSVIAPIILLIAIGEIHCYCYGCDEGRAYVSNEDAIFVFMLPFFLFFLAFSIIGLVKSSKRYYIEK